MLTKVTPFQALHFSKSETTARTCLAALLLFLIVSRGLFEIALGKQLAMLFQLAGIVALFAILFFPPLGALSQRQRLLFLSVLGFLSAALLSCLVTSLFHDSHLWFVYMTFNAIILGIALIAVRPQGEAMLKVPVQKIILILGWFTFFVSIAEMVHVIDMPGHSEFVLIRPSSTTGSFLHYPLIIALFGYICIEWGKAVGSRLYFWSGVVFCLSTFLASSRSGMLMVLLAMLLFPLVNRFRASGKIILFFTLLAVGVVAVSIMFSKDSDSNVAVKLVQRVTTATKSTSAGNEGRIAAWMRTFGDWSQSNMLVGEHAGEVTNATKNLVTKKNVGVSESSVTQLLVNFGLLGLLLFYGVLSQVYRFIVPSHSWIKCIFLAAMAQTLFYQSIEVVPFMSILFMLPWISQALEAQSQI